MSRIRPGLSTSVARDEAMPNGQSYYGPARCHHRWDPHEMEPQRRFASYMRDREMVLQVRDYSATETLRNGRKVEIRAIKPDDRTRMLAAVDRASQQSLYRRFFGFKRDFTEQEIDFYVNVDFVSHVALVALLEEDGQPVISGAARYIVLQPGQAELAFGVDDSHQGQGIGTALMRHLAAFARQAGLKELIADILPENAAMLKVFETSGLEIRTKREPDAIHVTLQLS